MKILPDRLNETRNDWWADTAFPPFETNQSLIYKNPNFDQAELDELIKEFKADSEIPRPKPFWDILFFALILLTFPWPFVGLSVLCLSQFYLGILLAINLTAFVVLMTRILVYWESYFPKIRICRTLQIIAIIGLISYYIGPFLWDSGP